MFNVFQNTKGVKLHANITSNIEGKISKECIMKDKLYMKDR